MSPKVKQSVMNVSAMLGAVVAVVGLTAPVAKAVDSRYVKTSQYITDSINDYYRAQFIAAKLAKIDTINAKVDTLLARQRRVR